MSFDYIRIMEDTDLDRQLFMDHLFEMVLRRVAVQKISKFLDIVYSIKTLPEYYDEEDKCYVYHDISVIIANILATNKIFKYRIEDNEHHYYIDEDMLRDVRIKFYLDI